MGFPYRLDDLTTEKTFDLTLDKWVYGGEAMGRLPDGRAVFVPYGVPGELVRLRLLEEKRGFARAELVEVLQAAPQRTEPRCKHFGVCGGCHYQHVPYEAQLRAKRGVLIDQLERLGGLKNPPVSEAIPSTNPWNYRNHVQFHVHPEGGLGFQAAREHEVIRVEECHLPEGRLNELWPQLQVEPVPDLHRVVLRLGAKGETLLILESDAPEPGEFSTDIPVAAAHLGPDGPKVLADRSYLTLDVLGRSFRVSAGAFFQVNIPVTEAMVEHLLAHLPLGQEVTLLEVYCGVGLFSAFLAPRVGRLIGVEANPLATEDFVVNLDEFDHVELYEGAAEDVLPVLEMSADVVLVDPPRAGLARTVLDAILKMAPPLLAYISCDPATLGRDAKRLVARGYLPTKITPFDMFPQTYHIESVSFWERT